MNIKREFEQCINKFLYTYNLTFQVKTTPYDEDGNIIGVKISFLTKDKNPKEIGYIDADIGRGKEIHLLDSIIGRFPKKDELKQKYNMTLLKIGVIYLILTYRHYNIKRVVLTANPYHDTDKNDFEFCLYCYYQKLGFRQIPGSIVKVDKNRFVSQLEMDSNPLKQIEFLKQDIKLLCN